MRCPNCGSNKISIVTKNAGYSMSKGLVGAAVLGPVGAIAGIDGKKEQIFRCPMCGTETHDLMNSTLAHDIDDAIFKFDTYGKGIESLRRFKTNYPNIEWNEPITQSASAETTKNNIIAMPPAKESESKGSGNIVFDIKEFLNNWNAPASYEDILTKVQALGYTEQAIEQGILSMIKDGALKRLEDYFVLVKDIEEIIQLKKEGEQKCSETAEYLESIRSKISSRNKDRRLAEYANEFIEYELKTQKNDKDKLTELLESQKKAETLRAEVETLLEKKESTIESQRRKLEERIQQTEQQIREQTEALEEKQAIIDSKKKELDNCSFFQGKIKKQLNVEIEGLTRDIESIKNQQGQLLKSKDAIENNIKNVDKEVQTEIDKKTKKLSSLDKTEDIDFWQKKIHDSELLIEQIKAGNYEQERYISWIKFKHPTDEEKAEQEEKRKRRKELLIEALSKINKPATAQELIPVLNQLSNNEETFTDQSIAAIMWGLKRDGYAISTKKGNTYYYELR